VVDEEVVELLVVELLVVELLVVELLVVEDEVVDELVVDELVVVDEVEEVVLEVVDDEDDSLKATPINPQSSARAVPKLTTISPAAPVSTSYSSPQVWLPTSSVLIKV